MPDPDRFSFPPSRSDVVMLVGLALTVYAAVNKAWGVVVIGVVVMLAGLFSNRMTGPFSFGNDSFNFKGELVDPTEPHTFRGELVDRTPEAHDEFN